MSKIGLEIEAEPSEIHREEPCPQCGYITALILVEGVNIYHNGRLIENLQDLEKIILKEYQEELAASVKKDEEDAIRERREFEAEWQKNRSM